MYADKERPAQEPDRTDGGMVAAAHALCEQGARLHDQAKYGAARARYEQALAMLEGAATGGRASARQAQLARCLGGLGRALMKLGDDAGAEGRLERALAIQDQVLGAGHPDRAATLHDLAELRSDRGDWEAGVALLRQAVSIRLEALGAGHPDTLESTAVLALLLAHEGERARAEEMLTDALARCERDLGERHRATARVLNALGHLWARDEATYDRAQAAYERALAIYEALLGPGHPWVALLLNNLAALSADTCNYEAARSLLERSLAIHEEIYGPDNWRTSFVLVNLADTFSFQGDEAAARRLLERALIIRERAWGAMHAETVRALRKLVSVLGTLQQAGDESAALEGMALFPCLTSLETAAGRHDLAGEGLPGSHLDPAQAAARLHDLTGRLADELARPPLPDADRATLETAHELARQADERCAAGDYVAAVEGIEEALRIQVSVLGAYHLDHIALLEKLAEALPHTGRYGAVLPIYERMAEIHLHVLGPAHPMTAQARSRLWQQIDYEYGPAAALPFQEQMLASMEASVGASDPMVTIVRQTVELLRARAGKAAQAGRPAGPSRSERREAALAVLSPSQEDLLAGLEALDWHSLQHCYGPADDVPDLLRLLLAEDEDVRQDAYQELANLLCHQGDVYQATGYAVPFLLRMLQAEDRPGKADLLAFLQSIATGPPYLTERHTWMEAVLAEEGRSFQAEIERARGYSRLAHDAVDEGLDIYLDLLDDQDPDTREWAFALLCVLPERAGRTVPLLLARLRKEPEPDLKARLIEHLGLGLAGLLLLPGEREEPVAELLEGLVRSGERGMVRFAAAAALTHILGVETPSTAVDVLEEAIAHPGDLYPDAGLERNEPAVDETLVVEEACAALSRIDPARRIAALRRSPGEISEP